MVDINGKLLGAKGIATRSKDATRSSWPYYTSNKDATRGSWPYYWTALVTRTLLGLLAVLLVTRTLLGAKGIGTSVEPASHETLRALPSVQAVMLCPTELGAYGSPGSVCFTVKSNILKPFSIWGTSLP